jgi:hypothetical protein
MLGFRWMATLAGAPDDSRYASAHDTLADHARTPLQALPKAATGAALPTPPLQAAVDTWLAQARRRRVAVMVHGFQFDVSANHPGGGPTADLDDPFHRVYAAPGASLGPVQPEVWLPLVGETDEAGNLLEDCAIGFGWDSDYEPLGGYAALENGFQFACLDMAPLAGRALATVLMTLQGKGVAVELISHSLGTRVACQSLRFLADAGITHLVQKVLYIEGSEFTSDAIDAAHRLPGTEFFNIGNQDDRLPPLGAFSCHPFRFNNSSSQFTIAHAGIGKLPNVTDLQIDRQSLLQWAAQQGYALDPRPVTQGIHTSGEHWASYIQPGNRKLLTDIMTRPDRTCAWFRDQAAPLGFSRYGYGPTDGYVIPPMPATAAERRALIFPH